MRCIFGVLSLLAFLACDDGTAATPCGAALCEETDGGGDAARDGGGIPDAALDAAADGDAASGNDGDTPEPGDSWVVTPAWLLAHAADADVQVVDVRGADAFSAGHVAGARWLDPGGLRATVDGVSGQVVAPADAGRVFEVAGVEPAGTVIVYGDSTSTGPARVVWTLAYFGHPDVRMLDGGMPAWSAAGGRLETGAAGAVTSDWGGISTRAELRVDADWILERLEDSSVLLIDARSPAEFAAGHIPGARNVDWNTLVAEGSFLDRAAVEGLMGTIDPAATVVAYCQSGSRASVDWVALKWLGHQDTRLYDGSWAEWSSRGDLPQE